METFNNKKFETNITLKYEISIPWKHLFGLDLLTYKCTFYNNIECCPTIGLRFEHLYSLKFIKFFKTC